jgi:Uri superfamily endonuclease
MSLEEDTVLEVGALGTKELPAGLYTYVGSAQSGLEQRVGRHFSSIKRKHWHIDYLLERCALISAVLIEGPDMECQINCAIDTLPGSEMPCSGFGSSDCGCRSHLHRIPEDSLGRLLNELRWMQAVGNGND